MARRVRDDDDAAKARAEALFRRKEDQKREGKSATNDYVAKQEAERAKMAGLRAQRLARDATKSGE